MTSSTDTGVTVAQLHGMTRGFMHTSLLRTGVELGVFDALADGPRAAAELAGSLGTHPRGTRVLLNALAAIGLLRVEDERYLLPPGGAELLVSTGSGYFGNAVRLGATDWEWDAHKRLADTVRKGGPVLEHTAEDSEFSYFTLWAEHSKDSSFNIDGADALAEALAPWAAKQSTVDVLDIGCGSGYYGFAVAKREPRARLWELDRSEGVVALARKHAEELGLADRATFLAADAFADPLGGPYDLVLIANTLHHFSAEQCTDLLGRVSAVLKPGGRVAVFGHIYADDVPPADNPVQHIFSLIMLTMTEGGEAHSLRSYREMLAATGFGEPQLEPLTKTRYKFFVADKL